MLSPIRVKGFRCRAIRGLGDQQQCAGKGGHALAQQRSQDLHKAARSHREMHYNKRDLGQSSKNTYKRLAIG